MKFGIVLILMLLSLSVVADCKLTEDQKVAKLKVYAQDAVENTYRTFWRYKVQSVKKNDDGTYKVLMQFRPRECKEFNFNMSIDDNCEISSTIDSIQGCAQ